jgi:hypothetical protein
MKAWILMGSLAFGAQSVWAGETGTGAALSPAASGSLSATAMTLTGRWGVGFDSIPGASAGTGLVPGLTAPNALAVRYWVAEGFCWDGLVAVNLSSQPSGGSGSTGVPAGTDQRALGVGTVMKFNLKRPTRWLLAQALGRASLASLQQVSNSGSGGQTTSTFGLGVGLGFEAFLPFWESLSVEGNILVDFSSSQTKVEGSTQAAQSGSSLAIDAGGFTPLNVGIHLYF